MLDCKKHGQHQRWKIHKNKNSKNLCCLKCQGEYTNRWRKQKAADNNLRFLISSSKNRAKQLDRVFELTEEILKKQLLKQNNKCFFTGRVFDKTTPISIDRIDSSLGYTHDNIQLVIYRTNMMKSNLSTEDFISLCREIANQHGRSIKTN